MTTTWTEPLIRKAPDMDGGLHVLIAEDFEDSAETMAIMLRLFGHKVFIARNGQVALDKARADKPDVVILDIALPLLSGYDVAKGLTGPRPQKTPLIIAVTGWGRAEDWRRSREAGIDLHLIKPADPDQILHILERFQRLIRGMRLEKESDAPVLVQRTVKVMAPLPT